VTNSSRLRQALHICRHACDLARADQVDTVTLRHIDQAIKQLFSNPYVHAVQGCSLVEKILVCATVQLAREGAEEAFVGIHDVVDRAVEILRTLAVNEPSRAQMLLSIQRLLEMRLLQPLSAGALLHERVGAQVQGDDVGYALREDPFLSSIASALIVA
jgi:Cdc6-like AAA superfamily ATPase